MFSFKENFYGSFHGNEYLFTISTLCRALSEVSLTGLCSDLQADSWEMLLQVATVRIKLEVLGILHQYSTAIATTGETRSAPENNVYWTGPDIELKQH